MIATPWIARLEADPVRISVGMAVVCGAAALIEPVLAGLTFALFALAVASFLLRYPRADAALRRSSVIAAATYACLAAGVVGYFGLPAPWEMARALSLALSATPLAFYARGTRVRTPQASP
ncbi:MAG: hypothetical protein M1126_00725 [Candidatus Thermoplasmatota archaeon]|jgi:hypothetical protein|nr:hypothetical protein [Candidatus Thermoplasmatota archaeon]